MIKLAARNSRPLRCLGVLVLSAALQISMDPAQAASAREIDVRADMVLDRFMTSIPGGPTLLGNAAGVLVFPRVIKAGILVGGEYGEGVLRIDGKTVDYYNTVSASLGFQLGAQVKSIVLVFFDDEVLADFRDGNGWKAGVDGSIAMIGWGAGEDINSTDIQDAIAGYVFDNEGLMFNLTLEGAKFSRIDR